MTQETKGLVKAIFDLDPLNDIDLILKLQGLIDTKAEAAKRTRASLICTGDIVRIVGNIKPKYMIGYQGKVLGRNRTNRIRVDFGRPIGRFGSIIEVPMTCLEVIS